jgi:LPS-assembly lipoprotein
MLSHLKTLPLLLLMLILAGCGYQLRGAGGSMAMPQISPLYISGLAFADPFSQTLRNNLAGAEVVLVDSAVGAKETLYIFNHVRDKRVHSVGSRGKVLEYELTESLSFSLGRMPDRFAREKAEVLSVRRIYTNPETETLGRQYEEAELRKDMYQQLASRLMRQMAHQVAAR